MKTILVWLSTAALLAGLCLAQGTESQAGATASQQTSAAASQSGANAAANASAAAQQETKVTGKNGQVSSAGQLQAGSTLQAQLVKPLDAKKNKVGDEVLAKTTHDVKSEGRVVIPKGSKLVGHVTEAKAHSKEQSNSELGIAFDRALLKNGSEIPLAATIQAIGRSQAAAAASEDDTTAMGGGSAMGSGSAHPSGGGLLGGVQSTTGSVVGTATNTAGAAAGTAGNVAGAAGSLSATSQGVVGIPGLSLSAAASSSTNGCVVSSQGSNVHLDSGTEMVLRVNQ